MNSPKNEKLLHLLGSVDDDLLNEALSPKVVPMRRRKAPYIAIAACAAVVLLTAVTLGGRLPGNPPAEVIVTDSTVTSAVSTTAAPATSAPVTTVPATTAPAITTTAATAPAVTTAAQSSVSATAVPDNSGSPTVDASVVNDPVTYQPYSIGNDPIQRPGDKPLAKLTLVESYPGNAMDSSAVPSDGSVLLSDSLQKALDAYGGTALYRVNLELFRDGNALTLQDGDDLNETVLAEVKRLERDEGLIFAFETYFDGKVSHLRLSLHLYADQLQTFAGSDAFGYRLSLFTELSD